SMAAGSLGGKGRGLAFVNTLIYNFNFSNLIEGIHIRTPKTVIIGTDEFDQFMVNNKLYDLVHEERNYKLIQKYFLKAKLTPGLEKKLKTFLKLIYKPIAVRSSSLLEDSINQPFSGIFNTFLLPNNNVNFNTRFRQTANAIKMVYASIYSDDARSYFEAVNFKVEDEQMAIVLQEVVGRQHDKYFYPHISGTAQSHNFYPYAHMKPVEGFALAALGLGHYVVEGDKSFRFSPAYPELEINTSKYLFKNSQTWFYAIDLAREKINLRKGDLAGLIKLDVSEAEKHKTLNHLASVYFQENDRLEPGLEKAGPRILNFSNILKYSYIPLAQTISVLLDVVKEAFGSPVEIEYAVDLNKDDDGKASFYLLQVKPLLGAATDYRIDLKTLDPNKIILYAKKSMGNGKIQDINDIIYVKPDKFNRTKTEQMAKEIEELNNLMVRDNTKYVLMGPGRWGTRDKFIGIPVNWPQISNAKVIVEMSLKDFPLDASLGSHFFHNVTSMNVGYFSVNHTSKNDFIMWDILEKQEVVRETEYFKHVCFCPGLEILMDGKKRTSIIMFND
ncbi:MAG: PEP/pyruvate-binding domain-containing protein, partial [Bacteroidota bacterium]|nr:PEP/pyruvate-binding domain-containing protein [Bacteroidota bacterium]